MIAMNPNELVVVTTTIKPQEVAQVIWVKRSPPVEPLDVVNSRIAQEYDDLLSAAEKNARQLIGRDRL